MAAEIDESSLTLEEFVTLPTTIDFGALNTARFRRYAENNPLLKVGTILHNDYLVAYANERDIPQIFKDLGSDFLVFYPNILSPLDSVTNEASGITPILNQPFLNLSGRNVIIGFVDTGIDYTKDAFKFEDGSTKILSIWDQTIDGARTEDVYFGAVYQQAQINEALQAEDPFSVVPSRDEDGHGTFLASVAASNEQGEYIGAAPKASIVAVKLRRARQFYIDRYLLQRDNPNLYESTDYLLGLRYIIDIAALSYTPVVLCIGMGSNLGALDGTSFFEDYISYVSQRIGYAFTTAAGNESNARHHTQGRISGTGMTDTISVRVDRADEYFPVTIFGPAYDKISIGITSPTGEVIPRLPFRAGLEYTDRLLLESTIITVQYYRDINNIIIIGFQNATRGIWDITLFGDSILSGEYYSWMPITGQVSPYVQFLRPVPDSTIVYPATNPRSITCGAYDTSNNSLYVSSSWGPTRVPRISPDLAAPGVNVRGIYPAGPGTMTGTSVAAAVTAGAAALLLEWGVVQGNLTSMDGDLVRILLVSGCTRDPNIQYPNNKWGYGKLNLFGTFANIRETIINYNLI